MAASKKPTSRFAWATDFATKHPLLVCLAWFVFVSGAATWSLNYTLQTATHQNLLNTHPTFVVFGQVDQHDRTYKGTGALEIHGITITGTLDYYRLSYHYAANGQLVQSGSVAVDYTTYYHFANGSHLPVQYLRDNPEISRPFHSQITTFDVWFHALVAIGLIGLGIAPLAAFFWYRARHRPTKTRP